MQMLRYNHDMVDMFSKETDYVIHTKFGETRIAGFLLPDTVTMILSRWIISGLPRRVCE